MPALHVQAQVDEIIHEVAMRNVVVAIAVLVLWVRSRPGMRTHLDRPLLLKSQA